MQQDHVSSRMQCQQHRSRTGAGYALHLARVLGGIILLAHPAQVQAQTPLPVSPGTEVRVRAPSFNRTAIVTEIAADTLTVLTIGSRDTVAIAIDALRRLEQRLRVGRGERAVRGAVSGAAGGAAVGLLGIVMSERGPGDPAQIWWPLIGAGVFTIPVTLAFVAIPDYRWEEVPLPNRVDVSVRLTTLRSTTLRVQVRLN